MKWKVFIVAVIVMGLSSPAYAIDIIGTGKRQTESLNNALCNLSQLVADVEVSSKLSVNRRFRNGKYDVNMDEAFSAMSDFYIENVRRYVSELSENRVVISLSSADINRISRRYRQWKQKADVSGSVSVDGNKAVVTLRQLSDAEVTITSIRVYVESQKVSMLCSDWKENQESKTFEVLKSPVNTLGGEALEFSVGLSLGGFNILDIGKRTERKVSAVVKGYDAVGRGFEVRI